MNQSDYELNNENELDEFRWIPLQCFDIKYQQVILVQYILYKQITKTELLQYIEEKFIEIDGVNNEWYHQFKQILSAMNNVCDDDKVVLYQYREYNYNNTSYYISNKL